MNPVLAHFLFAACAVAFVTGLFWQTRTIVGGGRSFWPWLLKLSAFGFFAWLLMKSDDGLYGKLLTFGLTFFLALWAASLARKRGLR